MGSSQAAQPRAGLPDIDSTAPGEERERLWGLAQQLTRGYSRYENTTQGREIPVLVLTPVR